MRETLDKIDSPEDFIYDPSLVLYLPLYRLDGASFISRDAYGHLCTVTGALWTPQGRSFNGVDDYINCGKLASLNNLSAFTLIAYIYPKTAGELDSGRIFHKALDNNTSGWRWNCASISKDLYFSVDYATTVLVSRSKINFITFNAWNLVALTWDGSVTAANVHQYCNGVESSSYQTQTDGAGARVTDAGSDLLLGNTPDTTKSYDGIIGEVPIYNRVLTVAEIQNNYPATKWRCV